LHRLVENERGTLYWSDIKLPLSLRDSAPLGSDWHATLQPSITKGLAFSFTRTLVIKLKQKRPAGKSAGSRTKQKLIAVPMPSQCYRPPD
jgi:hypothetical protein